MFLHINAPCQRDSGFQTCHKIRLHWEYGQVFICRHQNTDKLEEQHTGFQYIQNIDKDIPVHIQSLLNSCHIFIYYYCLHYHLEALTSVESFDDFSIVLEVIGSHQHDAETFPRRPGRTTTPVHIVLYTHKYHINAG